MLALAFPAAALADTRLLAIGDFGVGGAAERAMGRRFGNHDVEVDGGRYEFATLQLPGRYYSPVVGDVQLFVLDSNRIEGVQTRWLRSQLAASSAPWRIAVFHHPAWSCGRYRSNRVVRASWVPLFERFGVRLVLSGHDHNYQRFRSRGIEVCAVTPAGRTFDRVELRPRVTRGAHGGVGRV